MLPVGVQARLDEHIGDRVAWRLLHRVAVLREGNSVLRTSYRHTVSSWLPVLFLQLFYLLFTRRWIKSIMLGGGKPISGQGEARRAESGLGFHGKGHPASSPQAVGSESVSSPSGVLGEAAAAKRVSCILEAPDSPSGTYWGPSSGGHGSLAHP